MSFREKMHWVAFVAILLAFGWYFLTLPGASVPAEVAVPVAGARLIPVTLGIIAVMTLVTAVLAIHNRSEVDVREDERDRAIHRFGTHIAYYPMVVGTWTAIGLIFAGATLATLLTVLIAMVVVSELIRIGSQIWLYRRG